MGAMLRSLFTTRDSGVGVCQDVALSDSGMTKATEKSEVSKTFSNLARVVIQFKSMLHGMSYIKQILTMCTFMVSDGFWIG